MNECEVAIVGAGPYGLSAAAHLRRAGVEVQCFGKPMEFWAEKMPAGMLLRSPRVASNISGSSPATTLDAYERVAGLAARAPVPLETFVDYGRWFQREAVPNLDRREIATVARRDGTFSITLDDGSVLRARRVVVAAGIGPFQRVPPEFRSLPPSKLSHCYQGCDVRSFAGRRVAVIGAGQSALESAALLHEAGASVELIAKIPTLRWIGQHPWLHHLGPISAMLYSSHDVGPAGISRMVAAPGLMKLVPLKLRDRMRVRAVRPAGSQWLPARLKDVQITTGRHVTAASANGNGAELQLNDGTRRECDHVLLGTGYSVDIRRYGFLAPELAGQIDLLDGYPQLRSGCLSSVPGLHFVGATAARTFGPLLYFVAGTEFASTALTSHIVSKRSTRP